MYCMKDPLDIIMNGVGRVHRT